MSAPSTTVVTAPSEAPSGPRDFDEIPVIDVAALTGGDSQQRAATVAALGQAAREVGFFYVTGTGIGTQEFTDLLTVTQAFFALPIEEKMRVYIGNSSNHRGYVPEGEEGANGYTKDRKEAYDLSQDLPADDPDYLAGNPMLGPNQWPELPGFASAVARWYTCVFELGLTLMAGFESALELPAGTLVDHVTKPPSQLRLVYYPYNPEAEDAIGIGAHTDYECFTLLKPTAPGLEVLNGAGKWIDVPPLDDAFVVNIGDLLELWTGGQFVATSHRVRKVVEERYSFPLFFNVDYDTVVTTLPQFAQPDVEPLSLRAGEHLYAQTIQTFQYLQRRLEAGEIALPAGSLGLLTFGQEARHRTNIDALETGAAPSGVPLAAR